MNSLQIYFYTKYFVTVLIILYTSSRTYNILKKYNYVTKHLALWSTKLFLTEIMSTMGKLLIFLIPLEVNATITFSWYFKRFKMPYFETTGIW